MIYFSIILYNTEIEESKSYKSLSKSSNTNNTNFKIIFADNSDDIEICNKNKLYSNKHKQLYLCMNGNQGLSKAYNKVLDYIFSHSENANSDYVIWLDDDTTIPLEYFNEIDAITSQKKQFDIASPIIVGQDGVIWSPNHAGFLKNHLIKHKEEIIDDKTYNAINSCTLVKMNVYDKYRYDERLFLDQVDHKFFYDQRNLHKHFYKMQAVVYQDFSQRSENINITSLYHRLNIRFKDIYTYGRIIGGRKYILLAFIKCIGISLILSIRVKSIVFTLKCLSILNSIFLKKERDL